MEDERILALYRARDERAIAQTKIKYGKYCRVIGFSVPKRKKKIGKVEKSRDKYGKTPCKLQTTVL